MERLSVICFGAGGHAGMIIEMLEGHSRYEVVGLLDKEISLHGGHQHGVPVLGDDKIVPQLKNQGIHHFIIGVGATKSCAMRKNLYDYAISNGLEPITVIHKHALIMKSALIGKGSVVMPNAVINRNVKIGCNVIVNSSAVVEHDSIIGDHTHIASAACVAGGVRVGESVLIGANATIRETAVIHDDAVVGAASVVVRDVDFGEMVIGNPASKVISHG